MNIARLSLRAPHLVVIENDYGILDVLRTILRKLQGEVGTGNEYGREQWLKRKLLEIPRGGVILDAGAGELKYKKFCKHLRYTSQDVSKYEGEGNGEGLQTKRWDTSNIDIVSDIVSIPVGNNSFDAILCSEVFEHIPEPAKAIKEFSRILKNGGRLLITAPFSSLTHFAPYYFSNGFSRYWYEKILPENGFEIKELVCNGNYFSYLAQEIRRLKSVVTTYSHMNFLASSLLKVTLFFLLALLNLFNKNDRNSSELLCHGIFVEAFKRKNVSDL